MLRRPSILILLLWGSVISGAHAYAAGPSPKEIFADNSKRAASQYAEDKAGCADLPTPKEVADCQQLAKAEYDKNMSIAKANLKASDMVPGTKRQ